MDTDHGETPCEDEEGTVVVSLQVRTQHHQHLTWDLQPPGPPDNMFLLLRLPSLWCLVTAAPGEDSREHGIHGMCLEGQAVCSPGILGQGGPFGAVGEGVPWWGGHCQSNGSHDLGMA